MKDHKRVYLHTIPPYEPDTYDLVVQFADGMVMPNRRLVNLLEAGRLKKKYNETDNNARIRKLGNEN